MAIRFKAVPRKNPLNKTVKYYPTPVLNSRIDLERIISEIEESCTVHEADIRAVISAFTRRIITHLRDGNSVSLGALGNFRPSLTGLGVSTPEDVSAALITHARVVFSPSGTLRSAMRPGATGMRLLKAVDRKDVAEDDDPGTGNL